jgi:hypothetical protein
MELPIPAVQTRATVFWITLRKNVVSQISHPPSTARRTVGRHYFNPDEVLTLPRTPAWFASLQDRFLDQWKDQYARIKACYPQQPLFLPRDGRCNRLLSERIIVDRDYAATLSHQPPRAAERAAPDKRRLAHQSWRRLTAHRPRLVAAIRFQFI